MMHSMFAVAVGMILAAETLGGPQAVPTPEQVAWHHAEMGMFIHFAPNTWQDSEYDRRDTPLDQINPEQFSTPTSGWTWRKAWAHDISYL